VGEVKGRTALIVDDMVDTAGTLTKVAEALARAGAREVLASASHAVLSGDALSKVEASPLSRLIVTDSIALSEAQRRCLKLVVLSVAPLLGQAIDNIHEEASVTSLFV
jgi:ribose-phosphate pyrophosphokinase